MSRNALISFQKSLTNGDPAVVRLERIDTLMLRDAVLSKLIDWSKAFPKMSSNKIGTGIYEERQSLLRILDRLDCYPLSTSGRSTMLIGEERLSVGEVELIESLLKHLLGLDTKELLKFMKPSGAMMHVSIRRESFERMLKYVVDAKGKHEPKPVEQTA